MDVLFYILIAVWLASDDIWSAEPIPYIPEQKVVFFIIMGLGCWGNCEVLKDFFVSFQTREILSCMSIALRVCVRGDAK